MLTELCTELHNWFTVPGGVHFGTFVISNGAITPLDFLQEGQCFRIVGSAFNDGVYKYSENTLVDEVFEGAVWEMRIPPAVISLAEKIEEYTKSEASKVSPYTSESFGGYSYSVATNENGVPLTWREMFGSQLSKWRKM